VKAGARAFKFSPLSFLNLMSQITSLTVLKYKGFANKFWALSMMQFGHKYMSSVKGLSFYKLMGSGKDNFNPLPDWKVYAVLQVWEGKSFAQEFFENHKLSQLYQKHTETMEVIYLESIQARGEWNGKNPFESSVKAKDIDESDQIAVITRASIKAKMLLKFWKYVPESQKPLENAGGLLYTKGFGELPFVEMATFSIWENMDSLQDYAYRSHEHIKAIQKTRQLDWYSEELFSRFRLQEKVILKGD
jgi:spheroidene monooxygenase